MGMTNTNRHSLISLRGAALDGRVKARLRVYSLGRGADAQLFFSMRLWQAAADRQARLAGLGCAVKQAA